MNRVKVRGGLRLEKETCSRQNLICRTRTTNVLTTLLITKLVSISINISSNNFQNNSNQLKVALSKNNISQDRNNNLQHSWAIYPN